MISDDRHDRTEIHDLFSRYADAVTGRQWGLLDEVFTEDVTSAWLESPEIVGRATVVSRIREVIERTAKTYLLGNYTATIDGDVAEASVRVRIYSVFGEGPSRRYQKLLGSFQAKLIRTGKGWRFRRFSTGRSAIVELAQV
jgi:hypothetical protein